MTTATLATPPFYVMQDLVTLHVRHEQTGGSRMITIHAAAAIETTWLEP